jgi:hypothetical protein
VATSVVGGAVVVDDGDVLLVVETARVVDEARMVVDPAPSSPLHAVAISARQMMDVSARVMPHNETRLDTSSQGPG